MRKMRARARNRVVRKFGVSARGHGRCTQAILEGECLMMIWGEKSARWFVELMMCL